MKKRKNLKTLGSLCLNITQADIDASQTLRTLQPSLRVNITPLSVALARSTSTRWRTIGTLLLIEDEPPYRLAYFCQQGQELLSKLRDGEDVSACRVQLTFKVLCSTVC